MNIGIDIDETLTNTLEMLIAYGQMFDMDYLIRDGALKNIRGNTLEEVFGWSEDEANFFKSNYHDFIFKNVKIKVLAKEIIDMLSEEGHKIFIITARDREVDKLSDPYKISEELLNNNNIKFDKLVAGCVDKLEYCKENKIDIFIDDKIENCKLVSDGGIPTFIMNGQHNQGFNDEKIKRVYSWPEIYYHIKQFNM